ncbi:hypothetical protein [Methylobacterium sp. Leaf118]|uniref:hypothetical protein n=1 Tax=Methylobacterium sp. Leaf118 TaxID=2876562 RepID=UPI001E443398|nr:hypothetical protein [Methylobacterium sp. Leaf118]
MADEQRDRTDAAAVSPRDPVTGQVKAQPGPMERAGTEAEEAARGKAPAGEERGRPKDDRPA